MLRQGLAVLVLATAVGCSTSASFDPIGQGGRQSEQQRAQLAAYAASTQFPQDVQNPETMNIGAMIDRKNNTIKLVNYTDRALRDTNVWINGSYVYRVPSIPANGLVTLSRDQFFDASGRSMASAQTTANRVQLSWGDDLFNVLGPVFTE